MHPADSDRPRALALVSEKVAARFTLTAAEFVDRLMVLKHERTREPALWSEQLERLFLDDLYLATACARGDERAWQEFDSKHFAFIRSFAARFLTRERADEVASQLIADLWQRRKIAQFEGRSSLRTWLGAVVTRTALNAVTPRGERPLSLADNDKSRPVEQTTVQPAVEHREEGRLLAQLLRRAIDSLDDEDKLLVLLHYEQELTLEQMQPALGVSKATLSRRLQRVRERLHAELSALLRAQTGDRSLDSLKQGIDRARMEFDLSDALRGAVRLQGKRGDTV